ncbi:hypothetical protein B0H63DRAFT_541000 [Podospora didyma]|uniref:NFX1-type zinc finger-containing protein 1 n=2 Tax=Podospora didyma TaxID=330526 RepID=A0AAE0U196_9PEZI|nr:hypothetical protein B0H63DRAFT_541000 [Podospora didyma]
MAESNRRSGPGTGSDPSKPCFHFQQGSCKFGKNCKFSHDVGSKQDGRKPQNTRGGHTSALGRFQASKQSEGKLREWKRLLEQGSQLVRPSPAVISRFFGLGLELLDGDVGGAQEVIKLFASEAGLSFIKDVTDRHIATVQGSSSSLSLWDGLVMPLFKFITHPVVIDSAVLEQQVAMLFNFLCGIGGNRMAKVFGFVTALVRSWPSSAARASRMAAVELSLAVLSKILDCNTTNIVDDKFSALATTLSECLQESELSQPEEEFFRLQASSYLGYIRLRLNVGEEIAQPGPTRPQAAVTREKFLLRRDLPGNLSPDGPRHDNDHTDISKIKILPTYEEIISPRAEYLPTVDPSQWHVDGIRGRLDREFRLLREDTVGQLRDAIKETLETIRNPQKGSARSRNSARTYTYDFPTLVSVEIDNFGGLELAVRCAQLPAVQALSPRGRKDWWMQSKRLQAGALVCVLDATGTVLFYVVSESTMRSSDDKLARRNKETSQESGPGINETAAKPMPMTLSDDAESLFVTLQLVDPSKHGVGQSLRWYQNVGSSLRRYLVEFPGVLLASFKDTLMALQDMYRKPNMPFADIVAPSTSSQAESKTDSPRYARKAGFSFDLSCLAHPGLQLTVSTQSSPSPEEIASKTTLDPTQSAALLNTLLREMSLIQGPPGTGKSYTGEKIIKVLLANKHKAKLGPILCVCYTNHALDQLLEHLLDDGNDGVIRIGSRSKSERLQDLNLRNVVKSFSRTKAEKAELWQLDVGIRDSVREANDLLKQLSASDSWLNVRNFLANAFPVHHLELFGKVEDGWEIVNHQPEKTIDRWLFGGDRYSTTQARPVDILEAVPLSHMTHSERRSLHRHWVRSIRDPLIEQIIKQHQDFTATIGERDRLRKDVDLRCLQQANIVGVTTTGLARNLGMIRKLRCKVMLCEEAGEVLEAHILTTLLPSVEHAILIGDHLQLRPQIQNYDLQSTNPRGEQYSLDMSLFERLVEPRHTSKVRVPFSLLETQRRMHPSISELIRSTLYPSLKDADRVSKYPDVMGMKKRLFWFHHEQLEVGAASHDPLSTSHSNEFEIEMTTALVSHLVRQGVYSQDDIAVITPYLGQLQRLRRRMESMFEICLNDRDLQEVEALEGDNLGPSDPSPRSQLSRTTLLKSIRVATVDNFQGEEAKVIVICLVRSNPQNNCGFLRTSNRINVLLSRAQHGMYIIGNSNTYSSIPMWADVIAKLQANGNFGTSLELQCARHPDTPIAVSRPDHFVVFSPESGCSLPCEKRLHCGHACIGRCHSDILHDAVKCLEQCPRSKKGCDHSCPRLCGEACHDRCQQQLNNLNLTLSCGHIVSSAKCWEVQDPSSIRCIVQVTRTVPGCGHVVKVRCCEDVNAANYRCNATCSHRRPCGHVCSSKCFHCNTRQGGKIAQESHGICTVRCGREYSNCRHSCSNVCHGRMACAPCSVPCEVRCGHSKCSKLCHEPCSPCAEQSCHSRCAHTQCTMPCAAPCNWIPCSKRCEQKLSCGHQCPSICGEPCPASKYCQQCGDEQIRSVCVDFILMKEYHEIDLDEEPCIFPDCGHFLTRSSMDGQMDLASHYDLDANGIPKGIRGTSEPFSDDSTRIKVCPSCRGSLRNISRYGRIVRRGMLDEATKRFISWSNAAYLGLAEDLVLEQNKLQETVAQAATLSAGRPKAGTFTRPRLRSLHQVQQHAGYNGRYAEMIKLWHMISSFAGKVQEEEQPFQRVADLVKHANRMSRMNQEFRFDESIIQVKGHLLATTLLLKCEIAIFSDFFRLQSQGKAPVVQSEPIKIDWSIYTAECEQLIALARNSKFPREEVQAHIFAAQLRVFARRLDLQDSTAHDDVGLGDNENAPGGSDDKAAERLTEAALNHIKHARDLLKAYPSTAVLADELDRVENMVKDGTYSQVTAEEMRAVYTAMRKEFLGTGHWYRCTNGHPFTVGECGMPMEMARCPECGAAVGGQNHAPTEGVRRAEDIDNLEHDFQNLAV